MSEVRAGRIPYTGIPEVAPQFAPPSYQRIPTNPREFGAQIGAGLQAVGKGLQQTSDVFGQIAADEQVNHVLTGLDDISTKMMALRGKDALDQGPTLRQQGADLLQQARGNLGDAQQILDFDRQTRYLYSRFDREMGAHLDQQQKVWGAGVNRASGDLALNGIAKATQSGDTEAVANFTHDLISARMKEAQLVYGTDLSPEITQNIIRSSNAEAVKGQVEALLLTDPIKAQQLIKQNSQYFNPLELRALTDTTDRFAEKAQDAAIIGSISHGGYGGAHGGGTALVTPDQVAQAAQKNGVDPALANATADIESAHGANLGERGNVFQLGPTERASVGVFGFGSPSEQVDYGTRFLAEKQKEMAVGLGRTPTNAEVYLAHQQGTTGALDLLAKPTARAGDVVGDKAIRANGGDPNETALDYVQSVKARYDQAQAKYAGAPGGAPTSPMQQPVPGFPTFQDWADKIPDGLSDQSYDRVYAGLRKQYNHLMQATSAERSQVLAQYKGGLDMLKDGHDFDYDQNQIRRLFPKETADEMIGNLQDAQTIGHQVQAVRGMPISAALTQQAANHAVLAKADAQNYPRQKRLSDAFDAALVAHVKGLGQDPAGYIAATNPEIERTRQATMTPQTAPLSPGQLSPSESYAAKILGEEDRLQVPEDGRHVLDNTYAQGLAHQIASNPEQAPAQLKEMQQQWGSAWPAVWHDLSTVGKLPAAYQMVGALDNPADGALLARGLAEANKEGVNKSLATLIDKGAVGTSRPSQAIRSNIEGNEDITSYVHSMAASGASPDQIAGIVSSIGLLAQAKMLWGGVTNPAQAAQDAITSAIGKWEFMPNGGARIPRENAAAITSNAEHTVQGLTLEQLQHPAIYDTQRAPGLATAADWLRTLQAAPSWVTVGDGIRLMDNGGRFVRRSNGGFVEVPFSVAPPPAVQLAPAQPGIVP